MTQTSNTTTDTLWTRLAQHDWFYMFSDDHRYWSAGFFSSQRLQDELDELRCPYPMEHLRQTVQDDNTLHAETRTEIANWIKGCDNVN